MLNIVFPSLHIVSICMRSVAVGSFQIYVSLIHPINLIITAYFGVHS
jgi:hypothetical protein